MKILKQNFIAFLCYTGVGLLSYAFRDTQMLAIILLMFAWPIHGLGCFFLAFGNFIVPETRQKGKELALTGLVLYLIGFSVCGMTVPRLFGI